MKNTRFLFLSLMAICLVLTSFVAKNPPTDPSPKVRLPSGIAFSMLVDGQLWIPQSVSYVSYVVETESMGDNYVLSMSAYSTSKQEQSSLGENPQQESIHFSFSIPVSKIKNAEGTYAIERIVEGDALIRYSGLVHYEAKGHQLYKPNYSITEKVGTITLTKAEFGDQGKMGEFSIGDGLKYIEGTFEFTLALSKDSASKQVKISQGAFRLKTGTW